MLGDSLSAEYGLERGTGWVALLAKQAPKHRVVNASISGDTTSGGLSRLPSVLSQHRPHVVVIELGANDALRGLSLNATQDNLTRMVIAAQQSGARVLLLGMQVPPNYGPDYTQKFAALFKQVARSQNVPLVPFFLQGVADAPDAAQLFQADRIHPNASAQARMLHNVWPELQKLLPR
ncbi:MAG: arylesterase [Betaproteobacteria bacterium]|nr:arylesterase [Betaproteobacteria bacterium]